MIDLREFIIMEKPFLDMLNNALDKVIEEKQAIKLDYDLIEKLLKSMIQNKKLPSFHQSQIIVPIDKRQMLAIALDFFNSIDTELYRKAIEVILQQNKDIKMKIYNIHETKNFDLKDENGFMEHTFYGAVQNRNGRAFVNIPTKIDLRGQEEKVLSKNEYILDDLFLFVHEISHLFDLNFDIGKATTKEILGEEESYEDNITRELTGEATAIAFEGLLAEYLLKNTSFSKIAIQQIRNYRINDCINHAISVHARLVLSNEKEEKGEVKLDFIERIMREYNISPNYVRYITSNIIDRPSCMIMRNRYAIGGLIAPTIIKTYKTKGAKGLKNYFEEAKKCNFESTLRQIGIELNDEGFNKIHKNFQEQMQQFNLEIEER